MGENNILLGVTGGIAAYKAVDLASALTKEGYNIDIIMTKNSLEFVSKLTFQAVTNNPVVTDMFEEPKSFDIEHISLAEKAELVIVAPATANIIGKVACGIADDMLTTVIMATKAPVLFCPAMNSNMYNNPIVQENMKRLKEKGYYILEAEEGRMACGSYGKGRFPQREKIIDCIKGILYNKKDLVGKRVLITAGPTQEDIDPVRFISNRSSGKMGYSIAKAAQKRGASVTVISGPVTQEAIEGVMLHKVKTTHDMLEVTKSNYDDCDIVIFSAAPADYRCESVAKNKIKKTDERHVIELVKNPDIAKTMGSVKKNKIHVGFCAETENLIENAKSKLMSKNFDIIVANDVTKKGAGFEVDTNIVTIINKNGEQKDYDIMTKDKVADIILDEVVKYL